MKENEEIRHFGEGRVMAKINVQPSVLDLFLYAGDGVDFRLICTDSEDNPVDIHGVVEAQIRLNRAVDSESLVAFTADMVDPGHGIVKLILTGDQTQALVDDPSASNGKFTGVWDVQWTATGAEPRTLCQGKVECVADVTR